MSDPLTRLRLHQCSATFAPVLVQIDVSEPVRVRYIAQARARFWKKAFPTRGCVI